VKRIFGAAEESEMREAFIVLNWNEVAKDKWNAAKKQMLVLCTSQLGLQVTSWMQLLKRFSV